MRFLTGMLLGGVLLAATATAKDPYMQADDAWISIGGTVESVTPGSFVLDYGDGSIIVEMNDGYPGADAYQLQEGDKVNVAGLVDDDFFETATIDASSIYVQNAGTYYFTGSPGTGDTFVTVTTPVEVSETVLQGTVTGVGNNQFTVNHDLRSIVVETDGMPYDPLDDEGYQRIQRGDVVTVGGHMQGDFFEGRVMDAETIIVLAHATD